MNIKVIQSYSHYLGCYIAPLLTKIIASVSPTITLIEENNGFNYILRSRKKIEKEL